MAQLVIRLTARTHVDPFKSAREYRPGDVVDVFPDGQLIMPQPTRHWAVLQVTGLSVAVARARLLEPDIEMVFRADGLIHKSFLHRRLRAFSWEDLPTAIRNTLLTSRSLTVMLSAVRNYIKNKRTGVIGDGA